MLIKLSYSILLTFLLTMQVTALPFESVTERKLRAYNLSLVSIEVLKTLLRNKSIPPEAINRAQAIAVFPAVGPTRGFWKTSTTGRGVVSRRSSEGWTAPAFFEIRKKLSSLLGPSQTTMVLLFNEDSAANRLSRSKITFFGDEDLERSDTSVMLKRDRVVAYEFVAGIPIDSSISRASLIPSNDDNQLIYKRDAKDVLFFDKEPALEKAKLVDALDTVTRTLSDASPNIITPDPKEFPDVGFEYLLARSLGEAKEHMKSYFASNSIRYKEDATDEGVVITAYIDLLPRGRRYRRAAFFIRIQPVKDNVRCNLLFKWLVQSQGFRENDWVSSHEDTNDPLKEYVEPIDFELKKLKVQ